MDERSEMLVQQYIVPNRHKPGIDEAVVVGTGVPVWALVANFRAENGDLGMVASGYAVPIEAVEAALAYYEKHKCVIDARLAANNAV